MKSKNIFVIAGPNGAGKTTFAREFLPSYAKSTNFVNADLIAQGLSPFRPEGVAVKAGRLVLRQIGEYAAREEDFAFETTLAGKSYAALLAKLKKSGYRSHIYFLWISSSELAIARIAERVFQGGHHVPAEDVRRRFRRGLANFFELYEPLADSWMLFDNSKTDHVLIAKRQSGRVEILDQDLFDSIKKSGVAR